MVFESCLFFGVFPKLSNMKLWYCTTFIILAGSFLAKESLVASSTQLRDGTPSWTQTNMVAAINNNNNHILAKDEPNPPQWPETVTILRDTDDEDYIRSKIEATQDPWNAEEQTFTCEKHFTRDRHALLFAPGVYRGFNIEVGYYVQLAGLGQSPDEVKFVGGGGPYVPALNRHLHKGGTSLDTFWRSAENFYVDQNLLWAVSQAAPLRRVHVGGDLYLHDQEAYASGGHVANSVVDGMLRAGGQQQFLVRHLQLGQGARGGAWSMVYSGCSGKVPEPSTGGVQSPAISVVAEPRVRMEKPYIVMKEDGRTFELRVPRAIRHPGPTVGPLLDGQEEDARDFSRVRVVVAANRETDSSAREIQEALDQGKDILLTPGLYELDKTLIVKHASQVVLGLGLATLVAPTDGSPCIKVAPRVPGVRIAGVMLEASERKTSTASTTTTPSSLLEWGVAGEVDDMGSEENPGGLFDVFCRVGGATSTNRTSIFVDYMLRLHSGHIIGDNLWLWRADHGALAPNEEANYPHISPVFWQTEKHEFRVETGAQFNGNDITLSGLAIEHANGHQTLWNGERGASIFYQCEFPYGENHEFAKNEFRGYKVGSSVKEHEVHAPGVYSNFRNEDVFVSTAIEFPVSSSVQCHNPFTVKLDNKGGITSILNGRGGAADEQGIPMRIYEYKGSSSDDVTTTLVLES